VCVASVSMTCHDTYRIIGSSYLRTVTESDPSWYLEVDDISAELMTKYVKGIIPDYVEPMRKIHFHNLSPECGHRLLTSGENSISGMMDQVCWKYIAGRMNHRLAGSLTHAQLLDFPSSNNKPLNNLIVELQLSSDINTMELFRIYGVTLNLPLVKDCTPGMRSTACDICYDNNAFMFVNMLHHWSSHTSRMLCESVKTIDRLVNGLSEWGATDMQCAIYILINSQVNNVLRPDPHWDTIYRDVINVLDNMPHGDNMYQARRTLLTIFNNASTK
jgi:hypothetical protein